MHTRSRRGYEIFKNLERNGFEKQAMPSARRSYFALFFTVYFLLRIWDKCDYATTPVPIFIQNGGQHVLLASVLINRLSDDNEHDPIIITAATIDL